MEERPAENYSFLNKGGADGRKQINVVASAEKDYRGKDY